MIDSQNDSHKFITKTTIMRTVWWC